MAPCRPPVPVVSQPAAARGFDAEERTLADIWAELLGVPAIGPEDDFFDLGGHSLMVARLQQRIEAAFGHRLSMAAIFHAPTVAQQAALLRSTANPARLIPIQRKGTRTPLFWIDPPPRLRELATALGPDQPIYGVALAPDDLDGLGQAPRDPGHRSAPRPHGDRCPACGPVHDSWPVHRRHRGVRGRGPASGGRP